MFVAYYLKIILAWAREIIIASKKVDSFSIIAPIMEEEDYPNFKLSKKKDLKDLNYEPFASTWHAQLD